MKTAILILLFILTIPALGQTDNVTTEKNQLNRELHSPGNSSERIIEIKKRLWELDEAYYQRKFKESKDMKWLCTTYKYRRTELDSGISSGFIKKDSQTTELYSQYENGIRDNCKSTDKP